MGNHRPTEFPQNNAENSSPQHSPGLVDGPRLGRSHIAVSIPSNVVATAGMSLNNPSGSRTPRYNRPGKIMPIDVRSEIARGIEQWNIVGPACQSPVPEPIAKESSSQTKPARSTRFCWQGAGREGKRCSQSGNRSQSAAALRRCAVSPAGKSGKAVDDQAERKQDASAPECMEKKRRLRGAATQARFKRKNNGDTDKK